MGRLHATQHDGIKQPPDPIYGWYQTAEEAFPEPAVSGREDER